MEPTVAERLARHLRKNRGVRIQLYGTVVPPGWTPEPSMASKLHMEPTVGYKCNWILRYNLWKQQLGHDKAGDN